MRKRIVAGNWKMNCTLAEAEALTAAILGAPLTMAPGKEIVLAVPFVYLMQAGEALQDKTGFRLGAQNCYTERSGAYTGEISAPMLASVGVDYVILGHSERREYFKESHAMLAKKVDISLQYGLQPIFCCGEPLDIRKAETQNAFVARQLEESLFHLSPEQISKVVIAYEPIWAIGTGVTATTQQAQDMHACIRQLIADKYGKDIADNLTILYGGSVKASNAGELFSCPDVDGGLVGGASLVADDFIIIAGNL